MLRIRGIAALIWTVSASAPARAQSAMETQRCIWRCLAEHGSASKAYLRCTERQCSGKPRRRRR